MKAVTITTLKKELIHRPPGELVEICLKLGKFKKENKELLTYLLFQAHDEDGYIETVKEEIDEQFENINRKSYYFIKKSVRKILRETKKYIRYSKKKETQVELLLYFCEKLRDMTPSISRSTVMTNLYVRQLDAIQKTISGLHEDLQYDYGLELDRLR